MKNRSRYIKIGIGLALIVAAFFTPGYWSLLVGGVGLILAFHT
jgi:hypothetical protein